MKPALTIFANWRTYDVNIERTCGYVKYRDARVVYFRQCAGTALANVATSITFIRNPKLRRE